MWQSKNDATNKYSEVLNGRRPAADERLLRAVLAVPDAAAITLDHRRPDAPTASASPEKRVA